MRARCQTCGATTEAWWRPAGEHPRNGDPDQGRRRLELEVVACCPTPAVRAESITEVRV